MFFLDPASAWLLLPNLKTKSGHAAARDAAQRADSNKFALLQHPDKRNRSHVKNWGQHQEKYGFSFKPGHAAQKGDRTDAECRHRRRRQNENENEIKKRHL